MRDSSAKDRRAKLRPRHLLYLASAALALGACIGNHPKACMRNSECPGAICDGQGFCAQECVRDSDCPCGAVCDTSCGLCLRADNGGIATCFAANRNLSVREALGACRGGDGGVLTPSPGADAACPPLPDLLMCGIDASAPPPDASSDAPADDAPSAPDDASSAPDDASTDGDVVTDGPGSGVES